jgi:hypothetical protein
MSLFGGRGGRSDDWSTPHARARARAAERLDAPLDPAEEAWLDDHVAGCPACAAAAADYGAQRQELRVLRDRPPVPPRDLWARTAAAIEREAGSQTRRGRRSARSLLAPYALLAGALIVAVAVGSLNLSQQVIPAASATTRASAGATEQPTNAAATPILVPPGSVAYLTQAYGQVQLNHLDFDHVCGPTTPGCQTSSPTDTQTIGPVASPDTVFGAASGDRPLVVVSKGNGSGGKVYVVALASQPPATPTPSPSSSTAPSPSAPGSTPTPTPTARSTPHVTPTPSSVPPSGSIPPTESPSSAPSSEPPSPSPSASATVVEIARDLKVLDTTAAYAPDGSAFAFTARPSDDSHGPDIYVWRVGDPQAVPITTDHRSVFGSWAGGTIVGSTMTAGPDGSFDRPLAFVLPPGATVPTFLPQAGRAWRPVVDPTGRTAVYWSGRLEASDDGLGWTTRNGRLVVGRWDDVTAATAPLASSSPDASGAPSVSSSPAATVRSSAAVRPSAGSSPAATATAPADEDQPLARSETTIAAGPLTEWDARWNATGTRLAVWIADENDPTVGRLSLYVVDPFDGRIDQAKPPLEDEPALAGFALTDGYLAWAAPSTDGSAQSSVLVLAWTGDNFGKSESAPGDVLLVR